MLSACRFSLTDKRKRFFGACICYTIGRGERGVEVGGTAEIDMKYCSQVLLAQHKKFQALSQATIFFIQIYPSTGLPPVPKSNF